MQGTIEDAAREVTDRGGRGIALRCDHTVDVEVESLFDRIRREYRGNIVAYAALTASFPA